MARLNCAITLLIICGCRPSQPQHDVQWQEFSGDRAYGQVAKIVSFGPRPSGSAVLEQSAAYIKQELRNCGWTVDEQVFTASTPQGEKTFRNIIAKTRVQHTGPNHVVIIGSHYDTKWMPNIAFVGANDGGSSTGALLEIARVTAGQPDLWLVFFDGEEAMAEYRDKDGLWGSKHFVEELRRQHQVETIRAMVLLDMVGDANLNITIPATATSWLVQKVFDAARDAGFRDHFSFREMEMLDDHVPFLQAGLPAVDLIDFEFGSAPGRNDYWHTEQDTLDKLSPHSLEIVGQTTLRLASILRNQGAAH